MKVGEKMEAWLRIDPDSEVPKYRQVVDLMIRDIETGIFRHGQRVPSINETSEDLLLSRDTVEKAYVYLKKKGILSSVRGKGYYVNQTDVKKRLRVALIVNKLSNYKRSIYYSLVNTLGGKASVDVYIYNHDLAEFETIIDNNLTKYDYFIILPLFSQENADFSRVIKKIPAEKVLIADRFPEEVKQYPVVYQEFEQDIQTALSCGLDLLRKYRRLNLIFPSDQFYSRRIMRGFQIFCQVHGFPFSIIDRLTADDIRQEEAYVVVSDDDLYQFIKITRQRGWKLGEQAGVVAYNENPVKEILEDGITTISTNHDEIGRLLGQMILSGEFCQIKSPFAFIRRNSL